MAANPAAQAAIDEYGVPLMPDEFADLMSRRWDPDLHRQATAYGIRFPDDFAGAWINMKANGVIIAFKNDVDGHRAALSNLVAPGSALEVRKVDWSLADLEAFAERIEADKSWFDSVGIAARARPDFLENDVDINFQGPMDAAGLILQHFDGPIGLDAGWTGPLPWKGPRGDLTIKVTDTDGHVVKGLQVRFEPVDPMVESGGEDVYGTDSAGTCVIKNLPAATYTIRLFRVVNDQFDESSLQEFPVVLKPGGTVAKLVVPAN